MLFTGLGWSVLGEIVPSGGTHDLGYSLSQYGPPSWWITHCIRKTVSLYFFSSFLYFIALFFWYFFFKIHGVGAMWYFAPEKKYHRTVTCSNLTTSNNLIWNLLALSLQRVCVCKIPQGGWGGGEVQSLAHGLIPLIETIPYLSQARSWSSTWHFFGSRPLRAKVLSNYWLSNKPNTLIPIIFYRFNFKILKNRPASRWD